MIRQILLTAVFLSATIASAAPTTRPAPIDAPRAYRGTDVVQPVSNTTIIAEAEEFAPASPGGWQALPWGANYYAATFANTFMSRKAFLGAPEQIKPGADASASITVNVPKPGRYL